MRSVRRGAFVHTRGRVLVRCKRGTDPGGFLGLRPCCVYVPKYPTGHVGGCRCSGGCDPDAVSSVTPRDTLWAPVTSTCKTSTGVYYMLAPKEKRKGNQLQAGLGSSFCRLGVSGRGAAKRAGPPSRLCRRNGCGLSLESTARVATSLGGDAFKRATHDSAAGWRSSVRLVRPPSGPGLGGLRNEVGWAPQQTVVSIRKASRTGKRGSTSPCPGSVIAGF